MIDLTQVKDRTSLKTDLLSTLVRKYGGPASNTLFDEGFQIFSATNGEGIIGYRLEAGCAVVYGDPLCDEKELLNLVNEFDQFCKSHQYPIIYMIASNLFAKWALENKLCHAKIEVGEELFLNPAEMPQTGANARLLRKKVKHAQGEGLSVQEHLTADTAVEKAIEQAGHEWLKGRSGPQIYLSHVHLFADKNGSRWFYAKQGEAIVGVLFLNRMDLHNGWLLNLLMPLPGAPNGTSELLVMEVLHTLENEGCNYLSFGVATGDQLGEIVGLGNISTWLAKNVYKAANRAFHLGGRRKYWLKYDPKGEPVNVLFTDPHIKLKQILAISKALNVSL